MPFTNKVVFITCVSSGIGWSLAEEFARRGARVGVLVVAGRNDYASCASRSVQMTELPMRRRGRVRSCSRARGTQLPQRSPRAVRCHDRERRRGELEHGERSERDGAEQIRTNLLGPMYAFEAVLPDMLARGAGHLVGVSSLAAIKGLPTAAAYCASKSGLNAYLESIRISLRSKNIAVTAICPGFVRTEMTAKNKRMFWVLDADLAAKKITDAIDWRKKVYSFPRRMALADGDDALDAGLACCEGDSGRRRFVLNHHNKTGWPNHPF